MQRTGLYVYWGALGDHSRNVPGHPLYQLFAIEMIAKALKLSKIYFVSLYTNKVERTITETTFFIQQKQRSEILRNLEIEILSFGEALSKIDQFDAVFLKARFRNKSRLEERSFDALKFEKLLEMSVADRTYLIDSDGELPANFFEKTSAHLLTYFADLSFYNSYTARPKSIRTISPILVERLTEKSQQFLPETDIIYIGNEGLKSPTLSSWLQQAAVDRCKVCVHGKWSSRYDFEILPRTAREKAYRRLEESLCTLQISKEKYQQFDFLAPRIYEAHLCGIPAFVFSKSFAETPYLSVTDYREFLEKVRCLRDGFSRDYRQILVEQREKLSKTEEQLLKSF